MSNFSVELERINKLLTSTRSENDEMKMKLMEQNEVSRRNVEYEAIIRQLRQEVDRLGEGIRRAGELELKITQFGIDLQSRNEEINRLSRENQELVHRLNDLAEANRKISEYESRLTLLSQEV